MCKWKYLTFSWTLPCFILVSFTISFIMFCTIHGHSQICYLFCITHFAYWKRVAKHNVIPSLSMFLLGKAPLILFQRILMKSRASITWTLFKRHRWPSKRVNESWTRNSTAILSSNQVNCILVSIWSICNRKLMRRWCLFPLSSYQGR